MGRNPGLAWVPSILPLPTSSLRLLGEGRTQRQIFPPAPSSSLWPFFLSLSGLAEAKENRASLALSLSPSLPALGGWFTPSPALARDLALVSSFSRASRSGGPAWAQAGPLTSLHFTSSVLFSPLTQGPVPQFPQLNFVLQVVERSSGRMFSWG